jgi:hypothetical protein
MHHRREGTLPGLHNLRIDRRVFFGRWLRSNAIRCGGVNFVWDTHNLEKYRLGKAPTRTRPSLYR